MSTFRAFRISASGLTAERLRMDIIANNLANAETTRTPEGPIVARCLSSHLFWNRLCDQAFPHRTSWPGVRVVGIVSDSSEPRLVYDPQHPDADADGYVAMPNVNVVQEMVDLISATRHMKPT